MHGELNKIRCTHSGKVYERLGNLEDEERCPCCQFEGASRPDIVWFGEMPMQMDRIYDELEACDLFISIGTSGHVYPAAGFAEAAAMAGAHTVELNLERSLVNHHFKESINGMAGKIVPAYVEGVLA